jgi:hypothetical protein
MDQMKMLKIKDMNDKFDLTSVLHKRTQDKMEPKLQGRRVWPFLSSCEKQNKE